MLRNVNIASYYTDKYALWLDFRNIDDNRLHGSGRRLENTSEGICLEITKKAGDAGKLSCYLYIFQDAEINISDAQFLNVVYYQIYEPPKISSFFYVHWCHECW